MSRWSLGVGGLSGLGLLGYYFYEKSRVTELKKNDKQQQFGKPKVGGSFYLVDTQGKPVSDNDFKDKFMLVYFGYTFCPDVCPEELDRMAIIIDKIKSAGFEKELAPIFISCDPKRDSVKNIREYLLDFHKDIIGLIGTHAQIKKVAKAYRLYFSAPPMALDDDNDDYLVDHSIFFYFMDKDGKYLAHYGRNESAEVIADKIIALIKH
ncbi:SCO1/SenC-domain-containing protein [Gorgonomyces haynaldii]|nr:SCO1/SenC-domain-containing protein [Gorgonomyces haynaldii]